MTATQLTEGGLEGIAEDAENGLTNGIVTTAKLMAYTGLAALGGYLLGDQLPDWVNQGFNYVSAAIANSPDPTIALHLPRGFGVPNALAVPEQVIFGHNYATDISMGYLAAAPVVAKYVGEHIIAPLVKPLVDVVRSR